jgi:hypothetical protein
MISFMDTSATKESYSPIHCAGYGPNSISEDNYALNDLIEKHTIVLIVFSWRSLIAN